MTMMGVIKTITTFISSILNKFIYGIKRINSILELIGVFFYLILVFVGLFLYSISKLEIKTLLEASIAFIIALIPLYLYVIKKRDQTLIMSFTTNYLIEEDYARLDELLGILIAGRLERLKIDPIDRFYKCLEEVCKSSNVEMRRRLSEALPALYKIDLEKSKDIVSMLRYDWDNDRWKSDNRRRAIESLSYIVKKEKKFVLDNLKIKEKDEFITLIAVTEILYKIKTQLGSRDADKFFVELINDMGQRKYSPFEIDMIKKMWDVLNMINSDFDSAMGEFFILRSSDKLYYQVFVARNFRLLCDGYPKCIKKKHCFNSYPERSLEFMEHFLNQGKHKYTRRPISKEDSLECLLILLGYTNFKDKVVRIIWKLFRDEDDIIRITSFDKIENIMEVDKRLAIEILNHIISNEKNERLVHRAKNLVKSKDIQL